MSEPSVEDVNGPASGEATTEPAAPAAVFDTSQGHEPCMATITLAASWVIVYACMAWHQGSIHRDWSHPLAGGISPTTSYLFGSLTTADFLRGQVWRALTATFVHFSLLHLVINGVVLYQLGRMIEPWYGSGLFLAIYVIIGAGANAAVALMRPIFGYSIDLQSGGGSGFLCGLIGLVAVVGLRSRERRGEYLLTFMAIQLIFLGFLGLVSPQIKNLVHAMGVLVGVAVAFADRWMMRHAESRIGRVAGIVSLVVILGSAVAQYWGNTRDLQRRSELATRVLEGAAQLGALEVTERQYLRTVSAGGRGPDATFVGDLQREAMERRLLAGAAQAVVQLDRKTALLRNDPEALEWSNLVREALRHRPLPGHIHRFRQVSDRLRGIVDQELAKARRALQFWNVRLGPVKLQPRK